MLQKSIPVKAKEIKKKLKLLSFSCFFFLLAEKKKPEGQFLNNYLYIWLKKKEEIFFPFGPIGSCKRLG